MSVQIQLTNLERALIILFLLMAVPLGAWITLGFPLDKPALGILAAAELGAVINFFNDLLGNSRAQPVQAKTV